MRLFMAGFVSGHDLKLSLVEDDLDNPRFVRNVRPEYCGTLSLTEDRIETEIKIERIGTIDVRYKDVRTGKKCSESINCGIIDRGIFPPTFTLNYDILLSTSDTLIMFPQALPIKLLAVFRPGLHEICDCCHQSGADMIHGACNKWLHLTCWIRSLNTGSSEPSKNLTGTYETCPLCDTSITHPRRLNDPEITFKAHQAGETSSPTEAQVATKNPITTEFYSPLEKEIHVWGEFPMRQWPINWPHSVVKEQLSLLLVQNTEKKLGKLVLRKWTGHRAQEFRDAEYAALKEVSVRAPSHAGYLVPKPVGFGRYQDGKDIVYFSIIQHLPSQHIQLLEQVQRLLDFHSEEQSQEDKFGFSAPTLFYRQTQNLKWHSSWHELFLALMNLAVRENIARHGPWEHEDEFVSSSILLAEQLLRPLNTRPSLTTGWLGDLTQRSVNYKPAIIYAPSEWEWATLCRRPEDQDKTAFELVEQQCDEPKDRLKDRLRLYCAIHLLLDSKYWRKVAMQLVKDLVDGLEPMLST
ncbi:hypothetical protein RBB50_012457 [Rhinocladiella similis]